MAIHSCVLHIQVKIWTAIGYLQLKLQHTLCGVDGHTQLCVVYTGQDMDGDWILTNEASAHIVWC